RCFSGLLGTVGVLGLAYVAVLVLLIVAPRDPSDSRAWLRMGMMPILWAFLPGAALFLVSLHKPLLIDRYLLMCAPGVALFVCFAAQRVKFPWRIAALSSLAVISATSLLLSYPFYARDSEDWRGAVQYAIRHTQPDDVILVDNGIVHPILYYYLQQSHAGAPRFNSPRTGELD